MYYITVRQTPKTHQMTLDELLFGNNDLTSYQSSGLHNTQTYKRDYISNDFRFKANSAHSMIEVLEHYVESHKDILSKDRASLYKTFRITKKSGGLRRIDAPQEELKAAIYDLKNIFTTVFNADVLYHTSAFAYMKHRSTLDAVKKHQYNKSRWFLKIDLSNFFGSTTKEFVMKMLKMIYPFCFLFESKRGIDALSNAIDIAFLDGVLPQGTPISPMITNIIMIPIDYELFNILNNYEGNKYVYTRYADDTIISSRNSFNVNKIVDLCTKIMADFDAPYKIKAEKTRYGSSSGRNWNLGLMLNANNEITVGHKKKKQWQSMVHNYIRDKANGVDWDIHDIQVMDGLRSYYASVEPEAINGIINHINLKNNVNYMELIKADLSL